LSSIKFIVKNDILSGNSTIKEGTNSSYTTPNLYATTSHINIGKSYNCKGSIVYKFDLTTSEKIEIKIEGFKFSAFRNSNETEFDESVIECKEIKSRPGSDIIPIVVGGGLTGFLVLSLVAYLVIRNRSTTG
jgi:hypothetical protein